MSGAHRHLGSRLLELLALVVLIATLASEAVAKVGSGRGGVKLSKVGRFQSPVYVDSAPGGSALFVVEQPGRIIALSKGKRRTFLDIRGQVTFGGEQGLLSLAFAPDYQQSGVFYVYYVTSGGDLAIEEYRRGATPTQADAGSARRVLTINHPSAGNHNGGQLAFGPDGLLYAGTGDGGGAGDPGDDAQNPNSLLGKLLRIDPRPSGGQPYGIPAGNPFAAGGAPEVYSLGLRNPFRFSFDSFTAGESRIAIGDVGQGRFEEIDYETVAGAAGANFGWNDFEGNDPFGGANPPAPSRHDRPIKTYPLTGGACAVIGGFVSTSKKLASIRGRYLYGDHCLGRLRTLIPGLGSGKKDRRLGRLQVPMLSSFGEGANGSLYATSLQGRVFKLVPAKKPGRRKR